jgi:hypothetical protein
MNRILLPVAFLALLGASAAIIIATCDALPASVAVKFSFSGRPTLWSSVENLRTWMLLSGVLLPLLIAGSLAWLPRAFPRLALVRTRPYGLPAPPEKVYALSLTSGVAAGAIAALFVLFVHLLVVEANGVSPPRLEMMHFAALMVAFLGAIAVLIVFSVRHVLRLG